MPRLIAFLRAINVGGHHSVTMEELRGHFEALGLKQVESFIASGNLIFASSVRDASALERKIEARLEASLGYEVRTFLRTEAEVASIIGYQPFPAVRQRAAGAFCVGFLSQPLGAAGTKALMAFKTGIDDFHAHGREVYWLCQKKQSESTFSNALFERALKQRATWRGMNTIVRLAAKYGLSPAPA